MHAFFPFNVKHPLQFVWMEGRKKKENEKCLLLLDDKLGRKGRKTNFWKKKNKRERERE